MLTVCRQIDKTELRGAPVLKDGQRKWGGRRGPNVDVSMWVESRRLLPDCLDDALTSGSVCVYDLELGFVFPPDSL